MPGNYQRHLEDFGICQCNNRSGIEYMDLEVQNERTGLYHVEKIPACADCFGMI